MNWPRLFGVGGMNNIRAAFPTLYHKINRLPCHQCVELCRAPTGNWREFYFEVVEILLSILDKIEIDLNIEFRCVVGSGATGVTGSNRDEWMQNEASTHVFTLYNKYYLTTCCFSPAFMKIRQCCKNIYDTHREKPIFVNHLKIVNLPRDSNLHLYFLEQSLKICCLKIGFFKSN